MDDKMDMAVMLGGPQHGRQVKIQNPHCEKILFPHLPPFLPMDKVPVSEGSVYFHNQRELYKRLDEKLVFYYVGIEE